MPPMFSMPRPEKVPKETHTLALAHPQPTARGTLENQSVNILGNWDYFAPELGGETGLDKNKVMPWLPGMLAKGEQGKLDKTTRSVNAARK